MNVSTSNIKALWHNPAIKGTLIVTGGSFVGSFFSYLLHFALGRMITVEEYGLFSSMLSLGVLLSIASGGFATTFIKVVAELKSQKRFDILSSLYYRFMVVIAFFAALLFVLIFLFKADLASYLNVADSTVFISFGLYLSVGLFLIVPSAYLQGLLRYKAFAFFNSVSGITRVIFPVTLLYLGYSVGGIYYGMTLGFVTTLVVSYFLLKKNLNSKSDESMDLTEQFKKIASLSVATVFLNAGINLMVNMDVVLAKHFLDNASAGIYSSAVTIGKILLFGSSPVTMVMFPQIASAFAGGQDYLKKFRDFFVLQLFVVAVGMVVFSVFSGVLVRIMFNAAFVPAVPYISRYVLFIGTYILLNFMMMYFLAINKHKIFLILIPGVLAQFILIELAHSSIMQIININIVISAILLLVSFLYYVHSANINNRSSI